MEQMLEAVSDLIKSLAWKWSTSTGLPYEDLHAEGVLCLVQALPKYDATRGAWTTFTYWTVTNQFRTLVQKAKRRQTEHLEQIPAKYNISHLVSPDRRISFLSMLTSLSEEAQQVVQIIYHLPEEVWGLARSEKPKDLRQVVISAMKEQGWEERRTKLALREIKQLMCRF